MQGLMSYPWYGIKDTFLLREDKWSHSDASPDGFLELLLFPTASLFRLQRPGARRKQDSEPNLHDLSPSRDGSQKENASLSREKVPAPPPKPPWLPSLLTTTNKHQSCHHQCQQQHRHPHQQHNRHRQNTNHNDHSPRTGFELESSQLLALWPSEMYLN